jgi:phage gp29-like protein
MATSRIIDPQTGKPFQLDVLTQELAAPQMMGVRSVWQPSVANRLTPTRLAGLLQAAAEGDAGEYLTLAEEMEERDGHYASVLGTRKLAVSGLDVRVDSATDDADDVRRADALRELVDAPEFGEMVADLVDALGKGYAVSEIMWDRSGRTWMPKTYKARDQRFFRFDRVAGTSLRLLDDADPLDGLPLAPNKFIVHLPRIRSGLPIRGGLARLASVAYMCKSWSWKDWMAFADIYGLPMRVGKYGPGATADDISTLMAAVANLGSDAAAAIPDSMKIEFQNAGNTAGAGDFFRGLAEWWDKQVSKGVIGQTMTADDGASLAQAEVHQLVRLDILTADAKALSNTLNRMLVRPFVDLNFGPGRYPRLQIMVPRPENLKLLVDALGTLVPLGLKVEQSVIRDKLGLPDPDDDSELLAAPATPPPAPPRAANREQRALNAEGDPPDDVSRLVDQLDTQMGAVTDAWLDQVRGMVEQATSLDDIRDGLMALQADLSLDDFAKGMREALDAAQALGRYDIMREAGLG